MRENTKQQGEQCSLPCFPPPAPLPSERLQAGRNQKVSSQGQHSRLEKEGGITTSVKPARPVIHVRRHGISNSFHQLPKSMENHHTHRKNVELLGVLLACCGVLSSLVRRSDSGTRQTIEADSVLLHKEASCSSMLPSQTI